MKEYLDGKLRDDPAWQVSKILDCQRDTWVRDEVWRKTVPRTSNSISVLGDGSWIVTNQIAAYIKETMREEMK